MCPGAGPADLEGMAVEKYELDWSLAPEGWNWAAQDEDGSWYWYRTRPQPGFGGGVWRAHSSAQVLAAKGSSNPDWLGSLRHRSGSDPGMD